MPSDKPSILKFIEELKANPVSQTYDSLELIEPKLKSMQSFLHYLPSALYVLDYSTGKYLFFSESVKKMCGFSSNEIVEKGISWVVKRVHPADTAVYSQAVFQQFLACASEVEEHELPNTRFSYNWRFKKKNGKYIHVLQQYFILQRNESKQPLLSLGLLTDISSVKSNESMQFTVAQLFESDGEEKILYSKSFPMNQYELTPREKEVIQLICLGESSKTIGQILNISAFTVRAHRRNIFSKLEVRNMAELCKKAIDNGLINPDPGAID
jgi:DNA-binding CsgD family transcriptional regulator